MPARITEATTGLVDGVNKKFTTSVNYKTDRLVGLLNGLSGQEITELGGNEYEYDVAPLPGDVPGAEYATE